MQHGGIGVPEQDGFAHPPPFDLAYRVEGGIDVPQGRPDPRHSQRISVLLQVGQGRPGSIGVTRSRIDHRQKRPVEGRAPPRHLPLPVHRPGLLVTSHVMEDHHFHEAGDLEPGFELLGPSNVAERLLVTTPHEQSSAQVHVSLRCHGVQLDGATQVEQSVGVFSSEHVQHHPEPTVSLCQAGLELQSSLELVKRLGPLLAVQVKQPG